MYGSTKTAADSIVADSNAVKTNTAVATASSTVADSLKKDSATQLAAKTPSVNPNDTALVNFKKRFPLISGSQFTPLRYIIGTNEKTNNSLRQVQW